MYMYKQDLALNNLQGLICHKLNQETNSDITYWIGADKQFPLNFFYSVVNKVTRDKMQIYIYLIAEYSAFIKHYLKKTKTNY